jgi:murein L,D-transpeptidase YcbB/YkuD
MNQAEMHEIADEPAAAKPAAAKPADGSWRLNQAEMHEIADEPAATSKPAAAVPAWASGAQRYNAAHAEYVSDFNELTNNSCLDASGQLDPQLVARWQREHGVDADGKIGPHTVAAARVAQAKAGPAGTSADQRVPV